MIRTPRPSNKPLTNLLAGLATLGLMGGAACDSPPPEEPDAGPADAGAAPPTDAGTSPDAGSPADAGPDGDTVIALKGRLKELSFVSSQTADGAQAVLFNADCNGDGIIDNDDLAACTVTADADNGSFRIDGLAPGSLLVVGVDRPGETCSFEPGAASACSASHFSTITTVNTGIDPEKTTDLFAASYRWLLEQAVRCGVAPTLSAAGSELVGSTTLAGTLLDTAGEPLVNVDAARLAVEVDGTASASSRVCFLEADDRGTNDIFDDLYRVALQSDGGPPVTRSTTTGRFLIFKANSATAGPGRHAVTVPDVGTARLTLETGKLGIVTVQEGQSASEDVPVDFEAEIVPIFTRNGCVACHRPGGSGYKPLPGLNDYYMDFTADPNAIHRSIVGRAGGPSRVDYDFAVDSKLIQMPLYEDPANHPNASFDTVEHPDAQLIIRWISKGAPRRTTAPQPGGNNATLTELMEAANVIGCSTCHQAERYANPSAMIPGRPSGGLPLDGCIPFFNYPEAFAPADNTLAVSERSAAENQRCVYWHLVEQAVDDDPHFTSQPDNDSNGTGGEAADPDALVVGDERRVNRAVPPNSMLVRNPLCGLDNDGNGVGDSCEDESAFPEVHGGDTVFDGRDANYDLFLSWIEAGALNTGTNGDAP